MKKIALTGVKPTGLPHIGNYFGAIKPAIDMASDPELDCYYFIADYHALNFIKSKEELQQLTKEVACVWLACGLDSNRIVLYKQSQVPEVAELNWLLCNVTSKGLMNRAHSYKAMVDKAVLNNDDPDAYVNMGLYNYPILMAADILLFNTKYVPIGLDQKQHIEMTRDIAKAFNKRYGNTLIVPTEIMKKGCENILGTDGRKMSKSYGNVIPVFASEAELKKIISRITTDSSLPTEPKSTDCLIFDYYKLVATEEEINAFKERFATGISWADAKAELFRVMNRFLTPIRDKYNYYMQNYDEVEKILEEGNKKARKTAQETIKRCREAVGL